MIRTNARSGSRRGRLAGLAAAAALIAAGAAGVTASPALAWGGATVPPPFGCTGNAHGDSWISGSTAHADTAESGNICLVINHVKAGLRSGNGSTSWNGVSGISYAHATASTSGGYDGGWHSWSASKVAS